MRALFLMLAGVSALGACTTTIQPGNYVLDGHTESITSQDLQEILAVVRGELYSVLSIPAVPPVYRIHVRSASRVEVWYGDLKRDKWQRYILVGRFPGYKGWMDAGGGNQLHGYPRPNQTMQLILFS